MSDCVHIVSSRRFLLALCALEVDVVRQRRRLLYGEMRATLKEWEEQPSTPSRREWQLWRDGLTW